MAKNNAKKQYSDADPLDNKSIFVSNRIKTGMGQTPTDVAYTQSEEIQRNFQNAASNKKIYRGQILKYKGTVNTGGMTARWLSSFTAKLSNPPETFHAYIVYCEDTPNSIMPPPRPIPSTKTGGEVITKSNSKDHKQCDLFDECIQMDPDLPRLLPNETVEIVYENSDNWEGCMIKRRLFQNTELGYDDLGSDTSARDSIGAIQTAPPARFYDKEGYEKDLPGGDKYSEDFARDFVREERQREYLEERTLLDKMLGRKTKDPPWTIDTSRRDEEIEAEVLRMQIENDMAKQERNAPLEDKIYSPITGKIMSDAERKQLIKGRDAYLRGEAPTPFDW